MKEEELSSLFKALGHPIRRDILDILKQSPKTTGELNELFPEVTRYAIMKHLKILEEGNLVVIKREGKYRKNYLNAVPLQDRETRRRLEASTRQPPEKLRRKKVTISGGNING